MPEEKNDYTFEIMPTEFSDEMPVSPEEYLVLVGRKHKHFTWSTYEIGGRIERMKAHPFDYNLTRSEVDQLELELKTAMEKLIERGIFKKRYSAYFYQDKADTAKK